MATTEVRLIALAQAIGADIKAIKITEGNLANLTTTDKTSLVSAINELAAVVGGSGATINDAAGDGDLLVTWSANKIFDSIADAINTLRNSILGGASGALDTLRELELALGSDANFATTIANGLNSRVRFDAAQSLTAGEQTQARNNIGAADDSNLSALISAIGNTDVDLVSTYVASKV
jgi:hypothetical protein